MSLGRSISEMQHFQQHFPFLRLPLDLQIHIFTYLEPIHLIAAINCSSTTQKVYLASPEYILKASTGYLGLQIQGLIRATVSFVRSIYTNQRPIMARSAQIAPYFNPLSEVDSTTMMEYLMDLLGENSEKKFIEPNDEPMAVLDTTVTLIRAVSAVVKVYSNETYRSALSTQEIPLDTTTFPVVLSLMENHRLTRAAWRVRLFGVIFYDYAERFKLHLSDSFNQFFDLLCGFELNEMMQIYNFMQEKKYHFKPTYPHQQCRYSEKGVVHPFFDPLACQNCRSSSLLNRFPPDLRSSPPASQLHSSNRSHPDPITIWKDIPEGNVPSPGWRIALRYENKLRRRNPYFMMSDPFTTGFYLWDCERLTTLKLIDKKSEIFLRS